MFPYGAMTGPTQEVSPMAIAARASQVTKYKKAPDAPKRFKSAFIIFSAEKHKEIKASKAVEGKIEKTTDIAKLVSEAWRELTPEDKQHWEAEAQKDKTRYEVEKAMYKGPWKIPANKRAPKDPTAPKRPMSAFLSYSNRLRAALKKENPSATNSDLSKMLSLTWKDLPADERKKFMDDEADLRAKYKIQMSEWRKKVAEEKKAERKEREAMAYKAAETRQNAPPPKSVAAQQQAINMANLQQQMMARSMGVDQQLDQGNKQANGEEGQDMQAAAAAGMYNGMAALAMPGQLPVGMQLNPNMFAGNPFLASQAQLQQQMQLQQLLAQQQFMSQQGMYAQAMPGQVMGAAPSATGMINPNAQLASFAGNMTAMQHHQLQQAQAMQQGQLAAMQQGQPGGSSMEQQLMSHGLIPGGGSGEDALQRFAQHQQQQQQQENQGQTGTDPQFHV